jgi:hypothetical protein
VTEEVAYRHLTIPNHPGLPAEGFAMWHRDRKGASLFFDVVEEYFESGRRGSISVTLSRGDGTIGSVRVMASAPTRRYECLMEGVNTKYVDALLNSLRHYPYIFVATGFTSDDGEDHLLPQCSYSASAVMVDGSVVTGTRGDTPPPKLEW